MRDLSVKLDASDTKETKESMAAQHEQERRARERGSNGLHFSAVCLANYGIQFDCKVALYVSRAAVAVSREWLHILKSREKGVELCAQCGSGDLSLGVLRWLFKCLGDENELHQCGLQVEFSAARWKRAALTDPEVMNEDQLLARMASLVMECVQQEVEFMCLWRNYPLGFAALLHPDADVASLMSRAKDIDEAYAEAKTLTSPFWKKAVKAMPLNQVVVEETLQLFKEEEWAFTDRCKTQVLRMFNHMASSLLSERAFGKNARCRPRQQLGHGQRCVALGGGHEAGYPSDPQV